ncbi:MAG: YlxR family protein [Acidimicrobiales bacterium]
MGCRRTCSAGQLIRVVRQGDASLQVGLHQPGRGAWLCRDSPGCFDRAVKRQAFDRAFHERVGCAELDQLRNALRLRPGGLPEAGSEGPVP